MVFNSIKTFRDAVERLCKKEKLGYFSCQADIAERLKDLSFEEISNLPSWLSGRGDVSVRKIRLPNSCSNLSSSDGFRLIILCHAKYQTITFLNIYPKRGKLGKLNQTELETKLQLSRYKEEFKANLLVTHDMNNYLAVIA